MIGPICTISFKAYSSEVISLSSLVKNVLVFIVNDCSSTVVGVDIVYIIVVVIR